MQKNLKMGVVTRKRNLKETDKTMAKIKSQNLRLLKR
jgi:hypothetical protein